MMFTIFLDWSGLNERVAEISDFLSFGEEEVSVMLRIVEGVAGFSTFSVSILFDCAD